jgi:hypothetical protein
MPKIKMARLWLEINSGEDEVEVVVSELAMGD